MITIEIPKYLRKVKLSNARNKKYFRKGVGKQPTAKKYALSPYQWVRLGNIEYLCDGEGERVIANPRSHGTPRYMAINGQKIYNGDCSPHVRSKMMSDIKASFAPYINELDDLPYPIKITLELHDTIREGGSGSLWDADNRSYPYIKGFQDCLTGNVDKNGKLRNKQVIPDDNVLYIPQPPAVKFIPVDNEEDRKLVFIIESVTDTRIIENKEYCKQLKLSEDGFKRIHNGSVENMEKW